MQITLELPSESRDFGGAHTLRIAAWTPEDCFKLGYQACQLEVLDAEFVIGTSSDATGKYLRLPVVKKQTKPE